MKKVLAVLVLIGVIWGGKRAVDGMSHKMNREEAQTRVRIVLRGIKQGAGATEYQTAVCLWKEGSCALTNLRAFEVGDAAVEKAAYALESAVVVVKGSVDGTPFVAHAARSKPLAWEH